MSFAQGKDTFVVLPTGYGKSLIYAVLPLVFDAKRGIFIALNPPGFCKGVQSSSDVKVLMTSIYQHYNYLC